MKISREWLRTYFDAPLPDAAALADALTFHIFEIEGVDGDMLDVKVTANRGHDCLSHRGIAKELSAILNIPMKVDPLRFPLPKLQPRTIEMTVDAARAPIAAAAYMRGIKIGPSPEWLKERLESIGQRSINNVVDATNYVMFEIGMPTHAFDATTFKDGQKDSQKIRYGIRNSNKGEQLTLLGGKFIELSGDEAVIMNASGEAVDIGGVKGGAKAELSDATTEILLSASKFEPVQTRKAAQRFAQRTEAAKRFENEMADELPLYAIHMLTELILEVGGGEIVSFGIVQSRESAARTVSVSVERVNAVLGTSFTEHDVEDALQRLGLEYAKEGDQFSVTVPFERLDLSIADDLVEEVGRIIGYDKVPSTELPAFPNTVAVNENYFAAEKTREDLIAKGYSEVFSSVFAEKGERVVANKVDGVRPYLRATLIDGLKEAYERNMRNRDLLGLSEIKIFEIGTVWKSGGEQMLVGIADKAGVREESITASSADSYGDLPTSSTARYQSFSKYPSITRDIALWVPKGTEPVEVLAVIQNNAGDLLVRSQLFDQFQKGDKTSYAFRLVFQSFDRTLTDEDANARMESISSALKDKGYEIR